MFVPRSSLIGLIVKKEAQLEKRQRKQRNIPKRKRRVKDTKKALRFFIPFMWGTCIGVFVGLIILGSGAAMCATGYYAEFFSKAEVSNGTHVMEVRRDHRKIYHMSTLTILGPVLMGIGCFVIVVACVVVFETRDKIVSEVIAHSVSNASKKHDFYDVIISKVKQQTITEQCHENAAFEADDANGNTTVSPTISRIREIGRSKGTVQNALKRIPMDIFAIDVNNKRGEHSVFPINTDPSRPRFLSVPAASTVHHAPSVLARCHSAPHGDVFDTEEQNQNVGEARGGSSQTSTGQTLPVAFDVAGVVQPLYQNDNDGSLDDRLQEPEKLRDSLLSPSRHTAVVTKDQPKRYQEVHTLYTDASADGRSQGNSNDDPIEGRTVEVLVHQTSVHTEVRSLSTEEQMEYNVDFESDSAGKITPRPHRRKGPEVEKHSSRVRLSEVTPTLDGTERRCSFSSNSDDNSLNLTEDDMRYFDMSPTTSTPDISRPSTPVFSINTDTTPNTSLVRTPDLSPPGTPDTSHRIDQTDQLGIQSLSFRGLSSV